MKRRRGEFLTCLCNSPHRISGFALLFLAIFLAYNALQLVYFTSIGPGPGFFPFWLSVLLGGLSAVMIARTFIGQPEPTPSDMVSKPVGYLRIVAVLISLALMVPLLETLGFRLMTLAMYLFLMMTLGRHHFLVVILVSAAGSFGAFHVFVHWLNVPLPVGIFGI